ncbi:MAG: RNA polymerase sigma factor [Candidatus Aminicenantes bacterium]|nr:RNA polymerase sigma factor [Candidatus Aminicenantes bacterium]
MDELINGLKKKDTTALKKVMDLYKNKIYNYLRLMVNDDQVAEELTQDTFVKVYFKAKTLRTNHLKSWIYAIATNLARSEFRKKRIKALFSISDLKEGHISYFSSFEDELILEQMIDSLPEKYRIPVVMKEINRFSFEDISRILNKPVGTIKTLVFRGKNQLRKNFSEPGDSRPVATGILNRGAKNEIY